MDSNDAVYDDRLVVLVLTVADRKEAYTAREIKAMRDELKRRVRRGGG